MIEVWFEDRLVERVAPFVVGRHRRPHPEPHRAAPKIPTKPATADWLGHLVRTRREQNFVEPTPQMQAEALAARRAEQDAAVFDVVAARMDPAVVDPPAIRAFLARFGPWDPVLVAEHVEAFFTLHPRDTHVQVLLEHLRTQLEKDTHP